MAAKAAIKKANPEFIPSVDASYSYDQSYDSSVKKRNPSDRKRNERDHSFTVGITVPIYDGGQGRAGKRKLIETATKAAIDKEKVTDDIKTQICSIWAALKAAKQNIIFTKEAVEMRELALSDTQEEYKAGVKIMDDVLKAQGELFEARSLLTQAEEQYFSNQCKANQLIGRMAPKYLNIADSDFSYKDHFAKTSRKF
jgi:outer membrane protein